MKFSAGQQWTYRPPVGFEGSRMVIGAVVTLEDGCSIICCSVRGAPRQRPDGSLEVVNLTFLPLTADAMEASVESLDGAAEPLPAFAEKLQEWSEDPRGMTTFTVPFEGFLDHLIANQMASIMAADSAAA